MLLEGPFSLSVTESEDTLSKEVHLDFREDFRSAPVTARSAALRNHISDLRMAISPLPEDSQERLGMLAVLQVAEQLQPHIDADEIPLQETIVITIQADSPFASLLAHPVAAD